MDYITFYFRGQRGILIRLYGILLQCKLLVDKLSVSS